MTQNHQPPCEAADLADTTITLGLGDPDPATLALPARHDGWTPFLRRLFLDTLAEGGRVTRAAEFCHRSAQSAYALRHRDPVFAASWDAACELARAPLADALYERALDGVTETIRRDGEVVAERHRHDSRLSIAVLHRLDKRCDLARAAGATHLTLAARWSEWLDLVGAGEDAAFADRLIDAPHYQLHQLPLRASPDASDPEAPAGATDDDPASSMWAHILAGDDGRWWTSFPPPAGYKGKQDGVFGELLYRRRCTAREAALLDRDHAAGLAADRAVQGEAAATFFAQLEAELDALDAAPGGDRAAT
jgi:hypothetical protein